jgi:hypothetical protein
MRLIIKLMLGTLVVGLAPMGASDGPDQEGHIPRLSIGGSLPPLSGEFLSGRLATLPDVARERVALLAFGFTYNSRFPVEAWCGRFRKEFAGNPRVTFYEIPMIGGVARLGRFFIDRGMRRGTPSNLQENVITVYGGVEPWKSRIGYAKPDEAYLVLLDPAGTIRWIHHGEFDERIFAELRQVVTTFLK